MVLAFWPTFVSGFALTPGDLGDARLIHLLLEHGYRWLLDGPWRRSFWDLPIFYPTPNTAAYSDVLLSAVPFYAPFRLLGVGPDLAFQLWALTVVSLNFVAMHLFLTRCVRVGPAPAAVGAFLFTFASPRLIHLPHLHLHVHFFTVVCVYAAWRLVGAPSRGAPPPSGPASAEVGAPSRGAPQAPLGSRGLLPSWAWAIIFWLSGVAQVYASFYLGWFLALGLAVCAGSGLAFRSTRGPLLAALWANALPLAAGAALAAGPLAWLGGHYLAAARTVNLYPYAWVGEALPNPSLWFVRGPRCWLSPERALVRLGLISVDRLPDGENALGIGPITTLLAAAGLVLGWRRPPVRVLLAGTLTLLVLFTVFWPPSAGGGPGKSLYALVFPILPAAGAVRVPGRVVLLLLLPASVGLALLLQRRPTLPIALAVLLVCLAEQGRTTPTYDRHDSRARIEAVAARVPPDAGAFFAYRTMRARDWLLLGTHLDAMWAALETGVPTVNGWSGRFPPGWGLLDNELLPDQPAGPLFAELDDWLAKNGVDNKRVAVIHLRE
jgi:hypothetical protein